MHQTKLKAGMMLLIEAGDTHEIRNTGRATVPCDFAFATDRRKPAPKFNCSPFIGWDPLEASSDAKRLARFSPA